MFKISKVGLLVVVAGCLFFMHPLLAAEAVKGRLVDAKWLEKNLGSSDVLILDASSAQAYNEKHIPGAASVDMLTYGAEEKPIAEVEQLYESVGVTGAKKIVIYDQGGSMAATRLFFAFDYDGLPEKNLFILDGGLAKWQELGLPVTKDVTPAKKGSFRIVKRREDVRARLADFLTATGDPANNAVVEALGANWHFGQVAVFNRAGHVPNSVMLPSADFYNADKTFKSPEDLRKMAAYYGVRPEQQVYTYCGGGVAASVPFFALKYILGYPRVKLYPESEMGWLADERELPYWTYDRPYLMRDTRWLQWSGGQIIRTYLTPRVTIIDVRPAEAFNQGHVPFALNVPADVFRSNLANPAKLAEILGAAGVNASHEAVVVSGAGLTGDAALAFAMLQTLGQKKVSVFVDSMDQWAKLGYPVKKDATVVGPQKTPHDLSIPPVTYPANFRKDVVIADPSTTHGVYPKVFIASGKEVPARAPDGKVVHLPSADLLNPDGTPKAAKDIWSVLTKAGVPRYAELVCFSDDPGEAAANYFVLKLMGFPDVKVLAGT